MLQHITPNELTRVLLIYRNLPAKEEEKLTFFIPNFPLAIIQYLEHEFGLEEDEIYQLVDNNPERFNKLLVTLTGKSTAAEAGSGYINVILDILNDQDKLVL